MRPFSWTWPRKRGASPEPSSNGYALVSCSLRGIFQSKRAILVIIVVGSARVVRRVGHGTAFKAVAVSCSVFANSRQSTIVWCHRFLTPASVRFETEVLKSLVTLSREMLVTVHSSS